MLVRVAGFLMVSLLAVACGGSGGGDSNEPLPLAPAPILSLQPTSDGWAIPPLEDALDRVSNNGAGYTGEIDRFEITIPADGRLQISLEWDHDADFDVVLASDETGTIRLVEGIEQGPVPEYIGDEVKAGQRVWIFVAGWEGEPGAYRLETILLSPGTPKFALLDAPDGNVRHARNEPLVFTFSQPLEENQHVVARTLFVGAGMQAYGHWCIEGNQLIFYPRLPEGPTDLEIMQEGFEYLVQFPRAARGLRAANGEYFDVVEGVAYKFEGWVDPTPGSAPRVRGVDLDPSQPWDGSPLTVEIDGALDPFTVSAWIEVNGVVVPTRVILNQQHFCDAALSSYLVIEPKDPLPSGAALRVVIPATVLRLGGTLGVEQTGFALELTAK